MQFLHWSDMSVVDNKELLLYNAPNSSSLCANEAISFSDASATNSASIACLALFAAALQLLDLAFKVFDKDCRPAC